MGKKSSKGSRSGAQSPVAGRGGSSSRQILYVGGRDCQVAHLREIAQNFGVQLIHHDGGLREAVSRIDTVLPSVECVFCPIDCISHDACLRVKTGCKKTGTSFIPLRNGFEVELRARHAGIERQGARIMDDFPNNFTLIGLHKLAVERGDGLMPELLALYSARERLVEADPLMVDLELSRHKLSLP